MPINNQLNSTKAISLNKENIVKSLFFLILIGVCIFLFFPEVALAAATTVEGNITKSGTIVTAGKPIVITLATIIAGVISIFKGSIWGILVVVIITVLLALQLAWVNGGMAIG